MRRATIVILAIILLLPALLQADQMDAKAILKKSYDHNMMDFSSATADLKMDYIDEKEIVEVRKFRVKAIKVKNEKDDLSRVLLTVTSPADESGTAFLSIEKPGDADDDQWLYMSALKRSFRKGGKSGKSESFMGSEFTYGDLGSKDVDKGTHKRLADEKISGIDCYVIESIPSNPKEEKYSKYTTWIDKKTFVPRRIKFFDLKNKLKKVMIVEKVEVINGDNTITRAIMMNQQTSKATRIFLTNINTKAKLSPEDFTRERMTKM